MPFYKKFPEYPVWNHGEIYFLGKGDINVFGGMHSGLVRIERWIFT